MPNHAHADTAPSRSTPVVLVGHCGPDMFMLRGAVKRALPGATIQSADDAAQLAGLLQPGVLLLVNRVLDGGFETESGIELIRSLVHRHPGIRAMLISNYPEAQQQAVEAGACPGFGKRDINSENTVTLLRAAAAGDVIRAT